MLTVKAVVHGSVADALGISVGDRLIAIDGVSVDDVIDVHYRVAMGAVSVQWEARDTPGQARVAVDIESCDEGLGIEFESPTADGIRTCNNRCVFCFVDQSPAKMRRPLYLKDDDFRYSFLAANFVTLTNLSDGDWRKIKDQHLSPLYVSVHATDHVARRRLLGNPTAPDILEQLDRLASWGIRVHTQVVLVPGYNDGEILGRTVTELAARWPDVLSLAIVPVGLTQQRFDRQDGLRRRLVEQLAKPDLDPIHREGLERRTASAPELRLLSREEAGALVAWATPLQKQFEDERGHTWLFLSDEIHLMAGGKIPSAIKYDGYVQYENGIGMVRALLDDWKRLKRTTLLGGVPRPLRAAMLCATLIGPTLERIAHEMSQVKNLSVRTHVVTNSLFGPVITVSGLLGGRDLMASAAETGLGSGDLIFIPRVALDDAGHAFLDGATLADLRASTDATVVPVRTMPDVVNAILASAGSTAKARGSRHVLGRALATV
jgi:NifB/MoaA-like Fe-S oxidoreductase